MRVDVGGLTLNVEGDVLGEGPALVILHGFTESAHAWSEVAASMTSASRIIRIDLVGHGASDAPDDEAAYTMDACVAQLARIAAELGLRRATWLGYSLGGRVALHLAAAHPALVRSLILESTSPGIPGAAERAARRAADAALAARIRAGGVAAFVDAWMANPLFESERTLGAAHAARVRATRVANDAVGLARSLEGMGQGAQSYLTPRLGGIRAPVLLVTGARDATYTDHAKQMSAVLGHARHIILDDCGHAPHRERPDAFVEAVDAFLKEHNKQQVSS